MVIKKQISLQNTEFDYSFVIIYNEEDGVYILYKEDDDVKVEISLGTKEEAIEVAKAILELLTK